MTVIHPNYRPTDPHPVLRPSHLFCSQSGTAVPVVGAYNDGLFMIVDEATSKTLLASWSWLIGNDSVALMTTGFGDAFFWKPGEGVYFLGVQQADVEFVDAEIDWFNTDFLNKPQVIDQVLRQDYLKQLVRLQRPLNYGEVFILEPWLMLGGQDAFENYSIGKCSAYLNFVAQAHREAGYP